MVLCSWIDQANGNQTDASLLPCGAENNRPNRAPLDAGNGRKSTEKHQISQAEVEQIFFNDPLLLALDERHALTETRSHALGRTDEGRRLHIAFTLRHYGKLIKVISARDMHRKERVRYEQNA